MVKNLLIFTTTFFIILSYLFIEGHLECSGGDLYKVSITGDKYETFEIDGIPRYKVPLLYKPISNNVCKTFNIEDLYNSKKRYIGYFKYPRFEFVLRLTN